MITPNSLQVKNYFGLAMIQSLSSDKTFQITNGSNVFFRLGCYWYRTEDNSEELIWDDHAGYAKINVENYRLWDNKEKMYFNINDIPTKFPTAKLAEDFKDAYLHAGNYPNNPHMVVSVYKFKGDEFIEEVE